MKVGDTVYFYLPKEFYDSDWVDGEAHFGNTTLSLIDFMIIKNLIGSEKTFTVTTVNGENATLEGLDGHWSLDLLVRV